MNYQENDSNAVPEQQYYQQQHTAYAAPPPVAVEKYEQELITEEEPAEKKKKKKKSLKNYLCCICCPCLPMWTRYCCCIVFLLIIIILIIVGVMAALFKIPTVEFNGPAKHPDGLAAFDKSNDTLAFNVNFGLKIGVVNYNIESVTFESIRTIAYYHTAPNVPVGGGIIHNVNIKSYGTSNFTFPFSIQYNPNKDEGYRMLTDIATKCGLLGGTSKEDLVIDYDLIPTVRIASVVIAPIIRQSSRFPCPVSAGQLTSGIQNL